MEGRTRKETDGFAYGRLKWSAERGVLEAMGREDLSKGEERGKYSGKQSENLRH